MRLKNFHWALALVGLILGVLLSLQFRVIRDIQHSEAVQRKEELTAQITEMKKERDVLQTQAARMRTQLDKLSTSVLTPEMKKEMNYAEMLAGVTELTGNGVEVTMKDSSISLKPADDPNLYIVHNEDILKVVNELKSAGAEAIAINGQRLIANTDISCSGPTIRVNKKPQATPFIITAIGNPETLESALKMKGGVIEELQIFGIQVSVKKLSNVTVPAYAGGMKYEYAR